MSILDRQNAMLAHHQDQFGTVSLHQIVSKLLEECGEVAACITRFTECRSGDDWEAKAIREIGDVCIVLTALCGYLGVDFQQVQTEAAERFLAREWAIKKGRT